jgi:deoxycytidylate deaminase
MLTEKRIKQLQKHASNISRYSQYKFKLGAVLFKGSKILSTGFNTNKTHPKVMKYFKHGRVHAEFDCLLHADPNDIVGASIYVLRMNKQGETVIAKPCPMCAKMMKEFGVEEAFWSTSESPFYDSASIDDLIDGITDEKLSLELNKYSKN